MGHLAKNTTPYSCISIYNYSIQFDKLGHQALQHRWIVLFRDPPAVFPSYTWLQPACQEGADKLFHCPQMSLKFISFQMPKTWNLSERLGKKSELKTLIEQIRWPIMFEWKIRRQRWIRLNPETVSQSLLYEIPASSGISPILSTDVAGWEKIPRFLPLESPTPRSLARRHPQQALPFSCPQLFCAPCVDCNRPIHTAGKTFLQEELCDVAVLKNKAGTD